MTDRADLAALVSAAQAGDDRAFEELVRDTHAETYTLAYRLTGDDEDARDVTQDTYLRAYRALDRFRNQCQFRTWLLTIGGNVLKDLGRRLARRRIVPLDDGVESRDGDPHQRAEAGETEERLRRGLERLPRMQREVFLLRAQQGFEYEDIAVALDTTPGAARVHFHYAVKRLKEMIA